MYDIITIGTATQDIFLEAEGIKRLKDPKHLKAIGFPKGEAECFAMGEKLEVEELYQMFGGGSVNSAITFARQGFKARSILRIGDDRIGRDVVDNLKKEGVDMHTIIDKNKQTAYSTILTLPDGERTILVYRGAATDYTKREIGISKIEAKWAYVNPGRIPFAVIDWFIKSLHKKGVKIAMNPSSEYLDKSIKQLRPLLKKIDVLILNRDEAAKLTKISFSKEKEILRKLVKLCNGINVMTDGPNGSYVSDGRFIYKAGVYKEKEKVDRTGAGDAFGSGFVAGLLRENDITFALKLGSANATSVVENMGAQEGILKVKDIKNKRFKFLDIDIEPLI